MGTVVVGYVPKPEGEAALAAGISEAKLRGSKLVVVNSHRGGQEFDGPKARAAEDDMAGIEGRFTLRLGDVSDDDGAHGVSSRGLPRDAVGLWAP